MAWRGAEFGAGRMRGVGRLPAHDTRAGRPCGGLPNHAISRALPNRAIPRAPTSTASHSMPRMPAIMPSRCCVSMCCDACPNSWNRVSTSRKVMSEGSSPTGGVWLHTMWATGSRTGEPVGANTEDCPHTSSILHGGGRRGCSTAGLLKKRAPPKPAAHGSKLTARAAALCCHSLMRRRR